MVNCKGAQLLKIKAQMPGMRANLCVFNDSVSIICLDMTTPF